MHSLGFVGTADSLTLAQADTVRRLFAVFKPRQIHHGDCLGSDVDVHNLARQTTARIVAHPPLGHARRAHLAAHLVLRPAGYVSRLRTIVACCEVLLVAMPSHGSQLRKGMVDLVARGVAPGASFIVITNDGLHSTRRGQKRRSTALRVLSALRRRLRS